mmetsp:Transcript_33967/g.65737  ORF Transcript_33967/g.65737 Transcript_33967/m.65737 type:complete len:403 (+) Transcript_33967:42-1250(+)
MGVRPAKGAAQTAPLPTATQKMGCCFAGLSLLTGIARRQKRHQQRLATTQTPCLAEAPLAKITSPVPEATKQLLTPPEVGAQHPGFAVAQPPASTETPGNRRTPRCVSGNVKDGEGRVPATTCTIGMDWNPELQDETISKAEHLDPFMPLVPHERSGDSPNFAASGNWLPETPFVSIAGMEIVPHEGSGDSASFAASGIWLPEAPFVSVAGMDLMEGVPSDLTAQHGSSNISVDSVVSATGNPSQHRCKTGSTLTGGASSEMDLPRMLFPIAEDATANLLKPKAKPKRQAKAKGRRRQRNPKPPAPVSLAHEVLLEEIEVRPGDAECFCIHCKMEPARGGLPNFSLVEAWSGARHSARRRESTWEAPPRDTKKKKKGSGGRCQTRGANYAATGQAGPKVPSS